MKPEDPRCEPREQLTKCRQVAGIGGPDKKPPSLEDARFPLQPLKRWASVRSQDHHPVAVLRPSQSQLSVADPDRGLATNLEAADGHQVRGGRYIFGPTVRCAAAGSVTSTTRHHRAPSASFSCPRHFQRWFPDRAGWPPASVKRKRSSRIVHRRARSQASSPSRAMKIPKTADAAGSAHHTPRRWTSRLTSRINAIH